VKQSFVLTPSRYVGFEEPEDDREPFSEKYLRLLSELEAEFAESAKLTAALKDQLIRMQTDA